MDIKNTLSQCKKLHEKLRLGYLATFIAGYTLCAAIPELQVYSRPELPVRVWLLLYLLVFLIRVVSQMFYLLREYEFLSWRVPITLMKSLLVITLINILRSTPLGDLTGYKAIAISGFIVILLIEFERTLDRMARRSDIVPYRR